MANIAAVLGWKHNRYPGISTRAGKITEWPEALGPVPSAEQIATWTEEYEAAGVEEAAVKQKQIERAARAFAEVKALQELKDSEPDLDVDLLDAAIAEKESRYVEEKGKL